MGASLTLAGVSACTRQPQEAIVPYVRQPEELVPGKPLFYATAMPFAGAGIGLLVENHEGRPTKIEGNPDHPTSRGATDLFAQAVDPRPLRPRSLADDHASRRDPHVRGVRRRAPRGACRTAVVSGALASASSAKPFRHRRWTRRSTSSSAASRRPSGCSGSRSGVTTRVREAGSHSASTSTRSTRSTTPTSSCRSTQTFSAPAATD